MAGICNRDGRAHFRRFANTAKYQKYGWNLREHMREPAEKEIVVLEWPRYRVGELTTGLGDAPMKKIHFVRGIPSETFLLP